MFSDQLLEWGDNAFESIFEAENSVVDIGLEAQQSEYWLLGGGGENFGDLSLSSLLGDSLPPEPGGPTCWSAGAIPPAADDMNTFFDFQDPTLQAYIDQTMQDLDNTEFCGFIEKAMKDQVPPGRTSSIQSGVVGPSNRRDGLPNQRGKRKATHPEYKEYVNTFATLEREQIGPLRKMQKTQNRDLKMQFSTSVSRWTEKTASTRTKTEAEKKDMKTMTGNVCVRCMILKIKVAPFSDILLSTYVHNN
ncbi:hypothetical protein H072_6523 [Dactylellina haptotyla CBS 200.50]|uniref:Uncharacterized protein n=1 Tax=Dactylellina haptotyla (strain CBS 200.50) TaxID=1284197 RepID=S8BWG9_DACHA|nr:hypothetical protein H072_6523 [Dactylellina haptotyla CBS 200.50]